jgi:hypothetical protein
MMKLDNLTEGLRPKQANQDLFTYKNGIKQRIEIGLEESSRTKHDLSKISQRLSKLETKTLLELFRNTLNKGKGGDLFTTLTNQVE